MRTWLACLSVLIITVLHTAQAAPEKISHYAARTAVAVRNTRDLLWADIAKTRPRIGRVPLSDISVDVDEADWTIDTVRVRRVEKLYTIVIPIGFVLADDLMDRAFVETMLIASAEHQELKVDRLLSYMDVLRKGMAASTIAQISNQQSAPIKYYCEYAEKTADYCLQMRSSEAYSNAYLMVKVASLAFVLGHELGHIASNDLAPGVLTSSIANERRADAYGLDLALAAGYNPIASIGTFLYLTAIHVPTDGTLQPECRLVAALRVANDSLSADADFQKYLQEHGTTDKLKSLQMLIGQLTPQNIGC